MIQLLTANPTAPVNDLAAVLKCVLIFAFSILMTLASIPFARRFRLMDVPNPLKIHARNMPRFGGFGIFAAIVVTALIFSRTDLLFLVGALIMWAVGTIDDRWTIRPLQKLAGQSLAGLVLFYVVAVRVPGGQGIFFGILAFFLTLALANAVNLLDGMDGLAAGNGALIFLALGALRMFHQLDPWLTFGFAAALLGFFVLNFPQAKVFMGDSGSLLIGYLLAYSLTLLISANMQLFVAGLMISVVPIFDLLLGIVRRLLNKKSILEGDRYHFYDNLSRSTGNSTLTVLIILLSATLVAILAILISFLSPFAEMCVFGAVVIILAVVSREFGWLKYRSGTGEV